MLKAVLLFIPVLSGYIFVRTWKFTLYRSAREEFQRLYFRAAFHGLFMATFGFLSFLNIKLYFPEFLPKLQEIATDLNPKPLLSADKDDSSIPLSTWVDAVLFAALTLTWGCTLGFIFNWWHDIQSYWWLRLRTLFGSMDIAEAKKLSWKKSIMKIVSQRGDDLEIVLLRAISEPMTVLITMDSRKVYVGAVVETVEPDIERKYLRILPVLSGYRREDTFEVVFTTNYSDIYRKMLDDESNIRHLSPENFEVVLPLPAVASVSLFDIAAYTHFTANSQDKSDSKFQPLSDDAASQAVDAAPQAPPTEPTDNTPSGPLGK